MDFDSHQTTNITDSVSIFPNSHVNDSELIEEQSSQTKEEIPSMEEKQDSPNEQLPHPKNNLVHIIEKQDQILKVTEAMKQKLEALDLVSKERLHNFQQKSLKYGKYLKLIQGEFFHIHDLLKKINKEIS